MADNRSVFGIRFFETVEKITVDDSFTVHETDHFIADIARLKQESCLKSSKKHALLGYSRIRATNRGHRRCLAGLDIAEIAIWQCVCPYLVSL
ncbi:hypothetical protein A4G99_15855 [Haladaptatus sp. R4]|nr:hypothetical protein A4G99_15855 [Haladaptatus sp. R4]